MLERIIDAPLLERTSRAVRLTPAGRSFLPEAKRILKLAASASSTARRIAAGKTGGIKIGFTAGGTYSFLPQLVTAMRRRVPEVDLSLKEMVSVDQIEALGSGEIDVGLVAAAGRPSGTRGAARRRRAAGGGGAGRSSARQPSEPRAERSRWPAFHHVRPL